MVSGNLKHPSYHETTSAQARGPVHSFSSYLTSARLQQLTRVGPLSPQGRRDGPLLLSAVGEKRISVQKQAVTVAELASPSSSQHSCESEPKTPSEVQRPKTRDTQKSSRDLSGIHI